MYKICIAAYIFHKKTKKKTMNQCILLYTQFVDLAGLNPLFSTSGVESAQIEL